MGITTWTAEQDAVIVNGLKNKLSIRAIAIRLGKSRGAVIGRSHRINGMIFPCDVERHRIVAQRRKEKLKRVRGISKAMRTRLALGHKRTEVMHFARSKKLTYSEIAAVFSISRQAIQQTLSRN
jgi:predicted DNA-binding protein YlxM (UPF0122 family)